MFIYSRILTKEKKGKVRRAETLSVQLIWIHISLHFLIYLFKIFYTEPFWLLMLSLAPSAGREDDGESTK